MFVNKLNNKTILEFPSVFDARESLKTFNLSINKKRTIRATAGTNGHHWYGVEGGGAAVLAMIENGYPEGAVLANTFREALGANVGRAEGVKRRLKRGPMGDSLDIHAVNRGQIDRAWTYTQRSIRKGFGIIRITVDIGGNCDASADSLRWRGVAALTLCEILTRAGYSVEIVAALATVGSICDLPRDIVATTITVKPRNVQPNYDLIAATVCLPGFFRTIGFGSICKAADENNKAVASSLGQYYDVSKALPVPEKITQLVVNGSIYSKETAKTFCNSSIKLLQG